ncbi:MAG: hypothetical protein ACE5GO_05860 [Anaerolineales bacterium]
MKRKTVWLGRADEDAIQVIKARYGCWPPVPCSKSNCPPANARPAVAEGRKGGDRGLIMSCEGHRTRYFQVVAAQVEGDPAALDRLYQAARNRPAQSKGAQTLPKVRQLVSALGCRSINHSNPLAFRLMHHRGTLNRRILLV